MSSESSSSIERLLSRLSLVLHTPTRRSVHTLSHLFGARTRNIVYTKANDAESLECPLEEEGRDTGEMAPPFRGLASHSPTVLGLLMCGLLFGVFLLQAEVGTFAKAVRLCHQHHHDGRPTKFLYIIILIPPSHQHFAQRTHTTHKPRHH